MDLSSLFTPSTPPPSADADTFDARYNALLQSVLGPDQAATASKLLAARMRQQSPYVEALDGVVG